MNIGFQHDLDNTYKLKKRLKIQNLVLHVNIVNSVTQHIPAMCHGHATISVLKVIVTTVQSPRNQMQFIYSIIYLQICQKVTELVI